MIYFEIMKKYRTIIWIWKQNLNYNSCIVFFYLIKCNVIESCFYERMIVCGVLIYLPYRGNKKYATRPVDRRGFLDTRNCS